MGARHDTEGATVSPTAILTALALAHEHGGARAALRATGLEAGDFERVVSGVPALAQLVQGLAARDALCEAATVGFIAGRAACGPRTLDISSILLDSNLVVRGTEGRSILRLPWFDADLFVSRQLADIKEMPANVRRLCVENYGATLRGERRKFRFTSCGHAFSVDSIPIRDDHGQIAAALGLARPLTPEGSGPTDLTPREIEVLQLAADGMSGPDIAEHLVVSPATVKTHFQNIYRKWGVTDRAGAVARALRQGLIH